MLSKDIEAMKNKIVYDMLKNDPKVIPISTLCLVNLSEHQ
jgi:hypothetical protein